MTTPAKTKRGTMRALRRSNMARFRADREARTAKAPRTVHVNGKPLSVKEALKMFEEGGRK